ncbi:hypothetical protein ACFLTV_01510 [Chloroflexota bacterium]
MEASNIPTVTLCTDAFEMLGRVTAQAKGFSSLPIVIVLHPIKPLSVAQVREVVDKVIDEIIYSLTSPTQEVDAKQRMRAQEVLTKRAIAAREKRRAIKLKNSVEVINNYFLEQGWSDGLPVIPPTEENVRAMLEYVDQEPQDVVACLAPRGAEATVEKIAINAVMAGCLPEYMPVIITAVKAMAEPAFNLSDVQTATNPVSPLLIVNGPIVKEIGLNYGLNVFGSGCRANATIGRAIRLILLNIGGGIPGITALATQGQPGKYSFCIAENEEGNPWETLHIERGFNRDVSTVTVVPVSGTVNINENSPSTDELLSTIVGSMTILGCNEYTYGQGEPLLVLSPEHAALLARAGFSKNKLQKFIYENTKIELRRLSSVHLSFLKRNRAEEFPQLSDATLVPLTKRPEDIMIVVAGGPGTHSTYLFGFGLAYSVTKAITTRDGTPIKTV